MTNPEWQKVAACLASFFPTMADGLTVEQIREWRRELDPIHPDAVCGAIAKAYRAEANVWPTPRGISMLARSTVNTFRGTYQRITGPVCDLEENKRQARIGMEMLRRRREQRQQGEQPQEAATQ